MSDKQKKSGIEFNAKKKSTAAEGLKLEIKSN
jgi:hypothetical protein